MKAIVIGIIALMTPTLINAQQFEWVKSVSGEEGIGGYALASDDEGNIYSTGIFRGTADFNPAPDVYELEADNFDIFVMKNDALGNLIWAAQLECSDYAFVQDIALDSKNNVYITGYFFGTCDFNPGVGEFNLTTSEVTFDTYILKLSENGDFIWAKQIQSEGDNRPASLAVDRLENVYITGRFSSITPTDFDPGPGVLELTALSGDSYVLKLDANGDLVWVKQIGGEISGTYSEKIELHGLETVYLAGTYGGTADFDPSIDGTFELTCSEAVRNIFVEKLDSAGNFIWVKENVSLSGDYNKLEDLEIDEAGNIHLSGFFDATMDFDPSPATEYLSTFDYGDIFIQKLSPEGELVWVAQIGDPAGGLGESLSSIDVDQYGNVYAIGSFTYADFDPSEEEFFLASEGLFIESTFILKLDLLGNLVWVEQSVVLLEDAEPEITECLAYDIVVNSTGDLYITGNFVGKTDFDPNPDETYALTSAGVTDHFLLKLNQNFIGINENSSQIDVSIYPNPIINDITIQVEGDFKIELFSMDGKLIFNETNLNGTHTFYPKVASGTYLLNIIQNERIYSSKVVVQ